MKVSKKVIRNWEKAMVPLMHKHTEPHYVNTKFGPIRKPDSRVNHKRRVRRIVKTSESEAVMQQRLAAHLSKFGAPQVAEYNYDDRKRHFEMLDRLNSPSK